MLLYLIQHAEAKTEAEDPARGLSELGLGDIRRVATYTARHGVAIAQIMHSGKTRALQTAQVLAEHIRPAQGICETAGLLPLDDPGRIAERLKSIKADTALVGHLPHLSKLASLLLSGEPARDIVSFRMAGILCIERHDDEPMEEPQGYGRWTVRWMLVPEVAG